MRHGTSLRVRSTHHDAHDENDPAGVTVVNAKTASSRSTGLKASLANALKQGSKRTALADVSNRGTLPALQTVKHSVMNVLEPVPERRALRSIESQAGHYQPSDELAVTLEEQDEDEALEDFIDDLEEDEAEQGAFETDTDTDVELEDHDDSTPMRMARHMEALATSHAIPFGAPVVEPKYTAEDVELLAFLAEEFVQDDSEEGNIGMVQEYTGEIFTYLHSLERKLRPNPNYMSFQEDLEWNMRDILLDWLVQVHARFVLLPETLFLAVNYIDRFLSLKTVSLAKLQLVGATALFIASKYEEIQCPSVQEIVFMVDNGYSADEVLKAERFMVGMLNFELGWPGPLSFLRRISKADEYDFNLRMVAKYVLEAMLMSHLFVATPPSFAAAMASYLARAILTKEDPWTEAHVYYSSYTEAQLQPAVEILVETCFENPRKHHAAIFEKYSDKKMKRVSVFVESWSMNRR